MSGALVELVAKGVQDVYLISDEGQSFFRLKYNRHTNFSQKPILIKKLQPKNNGYESIKIESLGDLINGLWLEGSSLNDNLSGTTFDLYIGGQKIDSQTYDFMADIWNVYMSETYTKTVNLNNKTTTSNNRFFPLHFFFCDNDLFLPLVAIQYHEVEIRVIWGSSIENASNVNIYGNYVYLDTKERESMVNSDMKILITQTQRLLGEGNDFDLTYLNHPVKSLFFGFESDGYIVSQDKFTFDSCDLYINGTTVFENLSPTYFHTVQSYMNSKYSLSNFDYTENCPRYTRYYMYSFSRDISSYVPTGTCNFSRLDSSKLSLKNIVKGSNRLNAE